MQIEAKKTKKFRNLEQLASYTFVNLQYGTRLKRQGRPSSA